MTTQNTASTRNSTLTSARQYRWPLPIPQSSEPLDTVSSTLLPHVVLAELTARQGGWGNPDWQGRVKGSLVMLWRISDDADADAIAVVRMSGDDKQKGGTAFTQAQQVMKMAADRQLKVGLLVVTVRNSGARPYDDRVDFEVITRCLVEGWCERVIYRGLDRVARDIVPSELFCRLLRQTRTDLHLDLGAPVDWSTDEMFMRFRQMLAAEERKLLHDRTFAGLHSGWLLAGKGFPNCEPFGVCRDQDSWMVCQPEQWDQVARAFRLYRDNENGNGGGRRAIEAAMRSRIDPLPRKGWDNWLDILKNEFYTHGEMSIAEYNGVAGPFPCRKVDAPYIPLLLFLEVQALIAARRGKGEQAPDGFFVLNGVLACHDACVGQVDGRGKPIRLEGRFQDRKRKGGQPPRAARSLEYRHSRLPSSRGDRSECLNFELAQPVAEAAVMRALRSVARDNSGKFDFSSAHRAAMEAEISAAQGALDEAEEALLTRIGLENFSAETWQRSACEPLARHVRRLTRKYAALNAISGNRGDLCVPLPDGFALTLFDELMCDETPTDPLHRAQRALALEACVSRIDLWKETVNGAERVRVRLHGPAIGQDGDPDALPVWPLQATRPMLATYALARINERKVRTVVGDYPLTRVRTSPSQLGLGQVKAMLPWRQTPRKAPGRPLPGTRPAWSFEGV